jgi:capsular exopolysaccharide synthesis family protein
MLRTSLMISRGGGPPQILLITSPGAGEGKSTISLNLAAALAQQGSKVLLVDADLRRPVLHQRIGLDNENGLSTALSSSVNQPDPQRAGTIPNLSVLCGGPVPPIPSELLGSQRMQDLITRWRYEYDFIVLDGPPVLPVTDAVLVARQCDAVLLVARHGITRKKSVERGYRAIREQTPVGVVLGTVLNAVPGRSSDFSDYYGYHGNAGYAEERRNEAHA